MPKTAITKSDNTQKTFPLAKIDGQALDLQQRAEGYDSDHIDDLKAAIEEGTQIDPIALYLDAETGTAYIGDGWHRYLAHHLLGKKQLPANLHPGGKEAAFLASLSANAKQLAKPRRRADIRKAVKSALGKFYYSDLSQCDKLPKAERKTMEQIADLCATTKQSVSRIAKDMEAEAAPKAGGQSSTSAAAAKPAQIDFWEQFKEEASQVITGFRARIADADQLRRFEQEPERCADEFEALADALQHEAAQIRKKAKSIRTGLKD